MKIVKKGFVTFLSATTLLTSCAKMDMDKLASNQELKVKPNPLELHADSVAFDMSALLPASSLKKGYVYSLEVKYAPKNKEAIALGEISFKGDDYAGTKNEPRMSKRFGFIYEEGFESGEVMIQGFAKKEGKDPKETPSKSVAVGVITTSKLVQPNAAPVYIPLGYRSIEEYDPQYVDFFFAQGSAAMSSREKYKNGGRNLSNYIASKNETSTVNLTGMHSPEGSETINSTLAEDRPEAVEKYYRALMKKYDYTDEQANVNFIVKPVVEDWTAFKGLLADYDGVSDTQKNEILSVIDGAGDFVSKELKLQTLSSYRKVLKDIYPKLRTSKTEILKIREKKEDAEISALATRLLKGEELEEGLSTAELAKAAALTPDLDEKEALYKLAINKGDKFYDYNNLGAIYLEKALKKNNDQALLDQAIAQFSMSLKKQESPEAYVNLAGAYLIQGNVDEAYESVQKVSAAAATDAAAVASAVKGYYLITKAEYNEAIKALSAGGNNDVVLYNKGLAYLLKGSKEGDDESLNKAKSVFNEAISANEENAYAYYGAAIVAARMGEADALFKSLAKSVQLNSELKDRAVKDLEFVNYLKNDAFLAIFK